MLIEKIDPVFSDYDFIYRRGPSFWREAGITCRLWFQMQVCQMHRRRDHLTYFQAKTYWEINIECDLARHRDIDAWLLVSQILE